MGRQKRIPVMRHVIGLIVLVALVSDVVLELRARNGADEAAKRLDEAQEDVRFNRFAPALTEERVQTIVGRPPIRTEEAEGVFARQTYVWRGVFRRSTLTVHFSGQPKRLQEFEIE